MSTRRSGRHSSPKLGNTIAEALEVTVLRPAPGLTTDDFVAANADIDTYLQRQPGFLWRRITQADDGTIVDIVAYDSRQHALAGASGISGEMADSPVHASIDHSSVEWRVTETAHLVSAVRR